MRDIQSKTPSSIFAATEEKKKKDNYNFAIKIAKVNKE